MKGIFWVSLVTVFFVYAGYPLTLLFLRVVRFRPTSFNDEVLPSVSLVIAAYNEEKVIFEKLENSLALAYPKERLQIVVVSDGSTDKTNEIVQSFCQRGVLFFNMPSRGGKTRALNYAVPRTHGEILVLSDANAMYQPDAIRKLVRHFSDPTVGAVSGDVRLFDAAESYAESEGFYYKYERWIQELESQIGSIIGADGAMYAVRRNAYQAPPNAIIVDDFVISMCVARQGFRVVYDAEAVAFENGTSGASEEFRRKTRIVAGGIQALKLGLGVPNFQQPLLVYCYLFHKLIRWCLPLLLIAALTSSGFLLGGALYQAAFIVQVICYLIAMGYALGLLDFARVKWVGVPFYFCLVNGAALLGIWRGLVGSQPVTWQRTLR